MGTPRSRSRELNLHGVGSYETGYYTGSGWQHISYTSGSNLPNIKEAMDDTLAPYPFVEPHNLLSNKIKVYPLRFDGEAVLSASNVRRHSGYNPANWTGHIYAPALPSTDWNYWKAKALASINPYRTQLDLPLFLFELRELPSMLRDLGHVLSGKIKPSSVPGGYLAYNFGWAPLTSDLAALFNFAESINKSRLALQNAANGKKISHKLGTKSSYGLQQTYSYALGVSGNYNLRYNTETTVKAWCTARVHLTSPLPPVGSDLDMLALRTAFGLNLRGETLWDAIPWTWLIDYFANIGDLISARNGYSSWKFKDLHCMVQTVAKTKINSAANQVGSMSYSGGEFYRIRKERSFMGSDPNVGIGFAPFLTPFQSSILGALGVATALRIRAR